MSQPIGTGSLQHGPAGMKSFFAMQADAAANRHHQSEAARQRHTGFRPEDGLLSPQDMVEISQAAWEAVSLATRTGEVGKTQGAVVTLIGAAFSAVDKISDRLH